MTDQRPPTARQVPDPRIDQAEIRLLRLPVAEALDAGHGPTTGSHRALTVIGLHSSGSQVSTGWGECAALETSGYWHETAASTFAVLGDLVGRLCGRSAADLVTPGAVPGFDGAALPMAAAAVEMAALDLKLKATARSLADWLGVTARSVPAGAAVGLGPPDEVANRVIGLAGDGYRRVKVKIEPTSAVEVVAAIVDALQALGTDGGLARFELHVDANGGFGSVIEARAADGDHIRSLLALAESGVSVIEQPFAPNDQASSRRLREHLRAAGLDTLVLADEAASTEESAVDAVASGAADGVVVKPSRLGGLGVARRVIETTHAGGHPVGVGGMVESALGRHSLAAVAALDGVTVTGDLSPARRWLADDPWPDLETTTVDGVLRIIVPSGPGVAPPPNLDTLDRYTIDRVSTG